jgi:hypothetical protein
MVCEGSDPLTATPAPLVRAVPCVALQGAYLRDWHFEPSSLPQTCLSCPNPIDLHADLW